LTSEHHTAPVHGGRIDTLGLDENGCPVIIEYKLSINENVINQGLFYLDWLMDHRKEFPWMVMEKLGSEAAKSVDWSAPRLLCVAGDFTRYDQHAVKQIHRNIELLRYRRFGDDLLMLELVYTHNVAKSSFPSVATAQPFDPDDAGQSDVAALKSERVAEAVASQNVQSTIDPYAHQRIAHRIASASQATRDLYGAVNDFLSSLGDDVQVKELTFYIAYKRIKNFACLQVSPRENKVFAYLKIDPATVPLEPNFTRDVRNIGHFGTGDLEVSMRNVEDFARAQPLFQHAYEGS
jgi:predicted transport protein